MRSSIVGVVPTRLAALAMAAGLLGAFTGCSEDTQLRVTGIEPKEGDAAGGSYVRVLGNRFTKDGARSAKVYFGDRLAAPPSFRSDGEMVVQAPGGEVGKTVDVLIIFEPGGEKRVAKAFTYVEYKPRTVDDIGTSDKPAKP